MTHVQVKLCDGTRLKYRLNGQYITMLLLDHAVVRPCAIEIIIIIIMG